MFSSPSKPPDAAAGQQQPQVASRKRRRDITTLSMFKEYIYQKGIPHFHALVEQNPILMYPPAGIDEARENIKLLGILKDFGAAGDNETNNLSLEATDAMIMKRFQKEGGGEVEPAKIQRSHAVEFDEFLNELEGMVSAPAAVPPPVGVQQTKETAPERLQKLAAMNLTDRATMEVLQRQREIMERKTMSRNENGLTDEELANYHHKQLQSLIALFYDFNHTEFVKLPMRQTIDLLMRCGRESFAHMLEYEQSARAKVDKECAIRRQARIRQANLKDLMSAGKEAYFDTQLAAAERRHEELFSTPRGINNLFSPHEDVDDIADDMDMLVDAPAGAGDATMFSMFPGPQDDDEPGPYNDVGEVIVGEHDTFASTLVVGECADDSRLATVLESTIEAGV